MPPIRPTNRRDQARIEATAEHRRREDAAPRLRDEIPGLKSLRIRFDDRRDKGQVIAMTYSRPVVVASAPAAFEVPCMEPRCDGRHDITPEVLRGLRGRLASFAGESECRGMAGDVACNHVLVFSAEATYAD